jgi:hypothetical protein
VIGGAEKERVYASIGDVISPLSSGAFCSCVEEYDDSKGGCPLAIVTDSSKRALSITPATSCRVTGVESSKPSLGEAFLLFSTSNSIKSLQERERVL